MRLGSKRQKLYNKKKWKPGTTFITYSWVDAKGIPFYVGYGKVIAKDGKVHKHRAYEAHYSTADKKFCDLIAEDIDPVKYEYIGKNKNAAIKKEIELIKKFGRLDKSTGILLNKTDGGQKGPKGIIPWSKGDKIVNLKPGWVNPRKGKKLSKNDRLQLNYEASLDRCQKISNGKRKQQRTFKRTEEFKEKIRRCQSKSYEVICPDGRKVIVDDRRKFCNENKINYSNVTRAIAYSGGKIKGYIFKPIGGIEKIAIGWCFKKNNQKKIVTNLRDWLKKNQTTLHQEELKGWVVSKILRR